jgi:hypothetical protein
MGLVTGARHGSIDRSDDARIVSDETSFVVLLSGTR